MHWKAQYIEEFSDNDEYEGGMDEEGNNSYQEEAYETATKEERQEKNQPSPNKARISAVPCYNTFWRKGVVLGQRD